MDRLSDEQVQEMYDDLLDWFVVFSELSALALVREVQERRAMCCDGCEHGAPSAFPGFVRCGRDNNNHRPPDWFCADFTPKGDA